MGVPRNAEIPWTCPGCGRSMVLSGTQVNSGKKRCSSSCPRTLERKVRSMKYDNVRDSKSHGSDFGMVVDGTVAQDPETKEFVLVDDEGIAFSPQEYLKQYAGRIVRFTCVTMEDAQKMEEMIKSLQVQQGQRS